MSNVSNAPTLTPGDSASQVAPVTTTTVKSPPRKVFNKRPSKSVMDKSAPPGAVEVPKGGQNATGKKSAVVSGTIPLSGWGELDLASHRQEIQPTFTVDANPFADLVDTTYLSLYGSFSGQAKHIPVSIFRYYCFMLWWQRVLFLCRQNSVVLSKSEKDVLNVLSSGDEFSIPAPIAQYLANMGNFISGQETFIFRKLSAEFTGLWTGEKSTVEKGWLATSDSIRVNSGSSFWRYAQLPVPAVLALSIQAEIAKLIGSPIPDLAHIAPEKTDCTVAATRNIVGWYPTPSVHAHSSWRSTYSLLGWTNASLPPDCQTEFNLSTQTMSWVSDRLSSVTGLKLHGSRQITLSNQGSPIQAHFLRLEEHDREKWWATPTTLDDRKGTLHTELGLGSRYGMDDKMLSPSYSFGYRIQRNKRFCEYDRDGDPTYYGNSRFDPWVFFSNKDARVNVPSGWHDEMNSTFDFGSSKVQLNTPRFATHSLVRSVGLTASVILAA